MSETPTITFRPVQVADRDRLLAIAKQIWEGEDYLPAVFDRWVRDSRAYFVAMLLDGEVVGCGRLVSLDERRGWLETLRVDPAYQGRGLGHRMARHVIGRACDEGFEELLFSTYFSNRSSIRINEVLGFRRIAAFTNLELTEVEQGVAWASGIDCAAVSVGKDRLPARGYAWNDWLFLPVDLADRERYLPEVVSLRCGPYSLGLARNTKHECSREICWIETPDGAVPPACVAAAILRAHALQATRLHIMVPQGVALESFTAAGFFFYEQPEDVFLFAARAKEIRLPRAVGDLD
ncbi:MAG: GNAT family N-acetyltransferase [Candidatus Eisenbacteria sp.]|nr:GNAT family N-acetyltransferase [Candidatus Eisenbacteria bacterium]